MRKDLRMRVRPPQSWIVCQVHPGELTSVQGLAAQITQRPSHRWLNITEQPNMNAVL